MSEWKIQDKVNIMRTCVTAASQSTRSFFFFFSKIKQFCFCDAFDVNDWIPFDQISPSNN